MNSYGLLLSDGGDEVFKHWTVNEYRGPFFSAILSRTQGTVEWPKL